MVGGKKPELALIVAVARNGVIGRDNALPWKLPRDLKRFKDITRAHTVIMGRKTYESMGRPLPDRENIVVTNTLEAGALGAGVKIARSLKEALELAPKDRTAFVIGGSGLFAEAIPLADTIYYTHVDADVVGDVKFPQVDWSRWKKTDQGSFPADEKNEHPYSFWDYHRADKVVK